MEKMLDGKVFIVTGTADTGARVTLFFASPLSDYVSGQTIICGGGAGGF